MSPLCYKCFPLILLFTRYGATLSFVTPLVSMKFDVLLNVLSDTFSVITLVGDSIVAKRVYRSCPMLFPNRVTLVNLVELDTLEFDFILGMDWLDACFDSIECRTRLIKFQFPNEPVLEWKEETQSLEFESFCV